MRHRSSVAFDRNLFGAYVQVWAIFRPWSRVTVQPTTSDGMARQLTRTSSPTVSALSIVNRRSGRDSRSEEHTSELQSRSDLVCRLLLEKKTKTTVKDYFIFTG